MRALALTALIALAPLSVAAELAPPPEQAARNAGAAPIDDPAVFAAFGGRAGVDRIADALVERSLTDPRTADIFRATEDVPKLKRLLAEQFCYILGGGCLYTGRSMKEAHADMGLQASDMGALVEHLQDAMDAEGVPFRMQNRLLARLAPMKREVVER